MPVVALDFETANEGRASACAAGLAWIDGRRLERVEEWLIRPSEMRFSGMNIAIHGIHPEHVAGKPEFPDFWGQTLAGHEDLFILAHNASFDMSVLRASLTLYGLPWPCLSYLCTVTVARTLWPDMDNHKLPTVSEHLGIDLEHHRAGSDAEACALIALAAMEEVGAKSVGQLAAKLGITAGEIRPYGYRPCRAGQRVKGRQAVRV